MGLSALVDALGEAHTPAMARSTNPGNGPSPSRRERRFRLSGTAVTLGVATSVAVVSAGAVGALTPPLAVAAAGGALLIAAISTRQSRPMADLLPPLSQETPGTLVIDAPRASELTAGKVGRTDAA